MRRAIARILRQVAERLDPRWEIALFVKTGETLTVDKLNDQMRKHGVV